MFSYHETAEESHKHDSNKADTIGQHKFELVFILLCWLFEVLDFFGDRESFAFLEAAIVHIVIFFSSLLCFDFIHNDLHFGLTKRFLLWRLLEFVFESLEIFLSICFMFGDHVQGLLVFLKDTIAVMTIEHYGLNSIAEILHGFDV